MRMAIVALALLYATPAYAQDHGHHDMADMPGMEIEKAPATHQGHDGHATPVPIAQATTSPPLPADYAADRLFDPAAMARARAALTHENGGMPHAMVLVDLLEAQLRSGRDGYRWEAEAWFGGDIDRLTLKSQGEGRRSRLDQAEVQALWSHAIDPWFNLQAGVRQEFGASPARTYASVGIEGLAPYWFKVAATAFLSDKGDLTGRVEASHDMRLTQRLILTPRAELHLAAQGNPLREAELGARLGYMIEPRFTPYVGVEWRGAYGRDARELRAAGEDARAVQWVAGLRFWF